MRYVITRTHAGARWSQDRFILRVPTGRADPRTVDYKICAVTLDGHPAPEWVVHLREGSLVEVTLGPLAHVPVDDLGFIAPHPHHVYNAVAVRVFMPDAGVHR